MFVDSHCHLSFSPLAEDGGAVLARMRAAGVVAAVNVCTHLAEFERVHALALREPDVWCSVGVHPDHQGQPEPDVDTLVRLAQRPRVVAIGETGLDYYRLTEPLDWQRQRFRIHIHAACRAGLPLIVHSRAAARDTLDILREEGAGQVGGVMHCFTETREVAEAVLDLGFYISFSGIVSFRNADALRQVANYVPADRLLIETDAPYLAPVPMRGKTNEPANVLFVADAVARARGLTRAQVGEVTAENAMRLFKGLSVAVNATS